MPKKRKLFTKAWSLEGCCLPRLEAMRSGQKEGPGSLDEIELTCVESDPERIAFALSGIVTNHREQHLLLFSGGFATEEGQVDAIDGFLGRFCLFECA